MMDEALYFVAILAGAYGIFIAIQFRTRRRNMVTSIEKQANEPNETDDKD